MELKLRENKFYMLTEKRGKGKEITLYDGMKEPIETIKESLRKGASSEDIELLTIEVKEEKFEIKTIPWNMIAAELVKG